MSLRVASYVPLLMSLGLYCGCAAVPTSLPIGEDVAKQRSKQRETLIEQYEHKRNEAMLIAARSRLEEGNDKNAEELLGRLLDRDPKLAAAHLLMSDIFMFRGQLDLAAAEIETVLGESPENAAAMHAMGLLLAAEGRTEESRGYIARAAQLEPNNELYSLSLDTAGDLSGGSAQHATASRASGSSEPVDRPDPAACTDNPDAASFVELSAAALRRGDSQIAIREFENAVRIDPNNPQIPVSVAVYAVQLGQPAAARYLLEAAIRRFPTSSIVHRTLGLTYFQSGEFDSAEAAFNKAVSLDNRDALAYFLLGHSCQRLGKGQAADASFARAAQLDPSLTVRR